VELQLLDRWRVSVPCKRKQVKKCGGAYQRIVLRGSIKGQLNYIWKHIDGIGISKKEARGNSNLKSVDGNRQVSGLVHSYEYKDEIFKTGRQLGEFARENFGIKDFEKIDGRVIESFIEHKISEGVSKGTLDNYISHLSKIQVGLEKIANEHGKEYRAFTKEDLASVKEIVRDLTPNQHVNRAYNNPNALISNLSGKEFVAAKLQLDYGLRITEATFIKENQLDGNTLTFQGKGGYILQKELSPELANQIRSYMDNGVFKVDQNHFRESLKEACRIEGEEYTGAHGLRYNFAQNTFIERFENNLSKGMSVDEAEREALKYTSEEMGHHREEITKHYLG
jgi:integrase